jgi:tetratricopeptide (TPR) repeat protein
MFLTQRYDAAFDRRSAERSQEHFQIARTLADYGYFEESIEHYRDALLESRDNFEYRSGLSLALYYSGRYVEAENQLLELRAMDPTDAVSNRLLARVAAADGRVDQAVSFYRTALYGHWPRNPDENRLNTRWEMIETLEKQGSGSRVIGEVLNLLEEESPTQANRRRAARTLLEFGAYRQAGVQYEALLAEKVRDFDVLSGLGRARFELGDYAEAERLLSAALGLQEDLDTRFLRDLSRAAMDLDPNAPRLPMSVRRSRANEVLNRTVRRIESCLGLSDDLVGPPPPASQAVTAMLAVAKGRLEKRPPQSDLSEAMESDLLVAINLWAVRNDVCTGVWNEDDALTLVMRTLVP